MPHTCRTRAPFTAGAAPGTPCMAPRRKPETRIQQQRNQAARAALRRSGLLDLRAALRQARPGARRVTASRGRFDTGLQRRSTPSLLSTDQRVRGKVRSPGRSCRRPASTGRPRSGATRSARPRCLLCTNRKAPTGAAPARLHAAGAAAGDRQLAGRRAGLVGQRVGLRTNLMPAAFVFYVIGTREPEPCRGVANEEKGRFTLLNTFLVT